MNIDERLEALTHSVELLAAMHQDGEKRAERLTGQMERLTDLVTGIAEGTARLLHIQVHEQRLDDLEGKRFQQ